MPDKNRRQDFRIDDILAMQDKRISEDEFEQQKQHPGIRSRQNAMIQNMIGKEIAAEQFNSVINQDLASALETLDNKLNYLIGVNMLNDANRSNLKERPVNLSITGASFYSREHYKTGDYLSLTIMLPSFPPTILELVAQITWVHQEKSKSQHVGVQFAYRCNEEESSIGKYVFQRHRESIRLKVKETEGV
ncbi:PilZ domain-containing protein [bacterium AH-315-I20]|nr:PilZ domain-containing protein [Mariprofundus ferrooxydans]MBN4060505.1 PilZ domain-containing protein [bacterium AH-315-I20]